MEKTEISNRIKKNLEDILKHNRFEMQDDLKAADVDGWDSLTHVIIITGIEQDFNIKFKLKELNKLTDMGSLIELINSKL